LRQFEQIKGGVLLAGRAENGTEIPDFSEIVNLFVTFMVYNKNE